MNTLDLSYSSGTKYSRFSPVPWASSLRQDRMCSGGVDATWEVCPSSTTSSPPFPSPLSPSPPPCSFLFSLLLLPVPLTFDYLPLFTSLFCSLLSPPWCFRAHFSQKQKQASGSLWANCKIVSHLLLHVGMFPLCPISHYHFPLILAYLFFPLSITPHFPPVLVSGFFGRNLFASVYGKIPISQEWHLLMVCWKMIVDFEN